MANKNQTDIETPIGITTTMEELEKLEDIAAEEKIDVNQLVSKIVKERIGNPCVEVTYEEKGVIFERVMIDLPKQIADFYRCKAHLEGTSALAEVLIAADVCNQLVGEIEGIDPAKFKSMFGLDKALTVVLGE